MKNNKGFSIFKVVVNFVALAAIISVAIFGYTNYKGIYDVSGTGSSSNEVTADIESLQNNQLIEVDSCDLTATREPNVKVDVGFGDREYYGYTNEYGQLVYVQADSLKLQDSSLEEVTSDGRYCDEQAPVDGAKGSYNRGHAIGDALGGVSNAYNIFPQLQITNSGDYNNIEQELQQTLYDGGTVTDFSLTLSYKNSNTNVPDSYKLSFTENGEANTIKFSN